MSSFKQRETMLSYFNSITVPGLEHITVFRDEEDATHFYAMPSTPRLARDNQGRLLLDLSIYARDADKLGLPGRPSGCRPGIAAGTGHRGGHLLPGQWTEAQQGSGQKRFVYPNPAPED
jgi:hypothetical protein